MIRFISLVCCLISEVSFVYAGNAGGAPGIVTFKPDSTIQYLEDSYLKKRHKKGMEYAFNNATLQGLVEDVAIKTSLAAGGVPPRATDITLAIKTEMERIEYAKHNGLDLEFWTNSTANVVETVLVGFYGEALDAPLTAAKITAAFMTAYTYGFFFAH